jgi:hypothetical protein
MTDELKNATCSGCGEQVLVEANGQKDGFCACDPVCLVCGKQFKAWLPEFALIPENENRICEECLDNALWDTAECLFTWAKPRGTQWDSPAPSPAIQEWRNGYEAGQRSALRLFRFDVYLKLVSKYR